LCFVVSAPVQGHIIVRESIEDLELPPIQIEQPKPRELPAGIKERHPVYGADFTSILKKMEAARVKSPKKKKKKKSCDPEVIFQHASQNGKAYSNNMQNGINNNNTNDCEQSDSVVKKKKKKQKNNDSSIDEDHSFSNNNGTLERPSVSHRGDFSTQPFNQEDDASTSLRNKKSKKRKRDELDSFTEYNGTEENGDVVEPPVKKKKKSKIRYFDYD